MVQTQAACARVIRRKFWREYRKLTQQQVAEETGISVPFVSQLETAKRKASIDVMRKLASLLKVDIDDLV
ncbi:MAG: helix-turn-helix transcriptional regulator [Anaerolineaceae bacterium]